MKVITRVVALALLAGVAAARADDGALAPFTAEYDVRYGSLSVGSNRTELRRASEPDRWIIESRSRASGLAKLVASGTLSQRSSFGLDGQVPKPLSYRFDDGTDDTDQDVTLEFDWDAARISGTAKDEAVAIATTPGLQDAASIQALVLARLRGGAEPGTIAMIEKDKIKRYQYTLLRRERIRTALGELDTVVYRSARDGSSRETLFWYAPALGHAMVRAEQRRDGERALHTYIRRYQPGT